MSKLTIEDSAFDERPTPSLAGTAETMTAGLYAVTCTCGASITALPDCPMHGTPQATTLTTASYTLARHTGGDVDVWIRCAIYATSPT